MNAIAFANNDVAVLAWVAEKKISDCLGFAIYRTDLSAGTTEPLPAWVGFKGDTNADWKANSTEHWPVQKFHWKDLTAKTGGSYQYLIVPMVGTPGNLKAAPSPTWKTNPVHLTPDRGDVQTYFNRGILSTQSLSHQLGAGTDAQMWKVLHDRIDQPGDTLRMALAGQLLSGVRSLLDRAAQTGGQCYAALYELNDPELVKLLIGNPYVHLVLSDAGTKDSTNRPARQSLLESHIDITSRYMPSGHIGHNKFLVYADAAGNPKAVMAGSTNWTDTGLCGQANNAVIVENAQVATAYFTYWKRLQADTDQAAGNSKLIQAAEFRHDNQNPHDVTLADGSLRIWFSPNTPQRNKTANSPTPVDLGDVFSIIESAKEAVFFLAFQPGSPSIIDSIARAQHANSSLFVRGAVTDPKAVGVYQTDLYHLSGNKPDATVDPVVNATAVKDQFSFWEHELLKDPSGHAIIHDKIVVVDPFLPECCVVTGSHNLGFRASYNNDENMLVFKGKSMVARAYAAHVLDIYDHYRFRYLVQEQKKNAWENLDSTDRWQDHYFSKASGTAKEVAFWKSAIASGGEGPASVLSATNPQPFNGSARRTPKLGNAPAGSPSKGVSRRVHTKKTRSTPSAADAGST